MTVDEYVRKVLDPAVPDDDLAEMFFEIDTAGMSEQRKNDTYTLALDALRLNRAEAHGMLPSSIRGLQRKIIDQE